MEIEFSTRNPKQLLAAEKWIDHIIEQLLYGGAKYGGKTYLGCSLIFGDALIYPDTQYFIARQTLADLRKFTIPSVHERFEHWGLEIEKYAKFNGQDNVFNCYNGSKVFLLECKENPSDPLFERFGSMQMTRGWIEEGGEVAEKAKANLFLAVGRWKNDKYYLKKKLLITANPKKGWMKREFVEPYKQGVLTSDKAYIQAFATDNVHGSKDYIKSLRNEKDTVRKQRLWGGSWDYDEDKDLLISEDALSDAFSNTIVKDGENYLTVDVARLGKDTTVFSFWDGLELYRIEQREKQGTDKTEQQVRDFAALEKIPYSHILIDEDGIGGGVVDHLLGVKGFTANSSPLLTSSQIREKQEKIHNFLETKPNYKNLKAQCGWKLAELINEHKIAFKAENYRETIIEELSSLLRDKSVDSDGKKQLRPKEEVKEELLRSPDIGDTLIMRAWFELKKESLNEDPKKDKELLQRQEDHFLRIANLNRRGLNSTK